MTLVKLFHPLCQNCPLLVQRVILQKLFLWECRNSNLFSNYRVIFSELGLAFFSRFVNTTFYVFSKRCHGKLFPFGKNVLFLTFSSFERIFFRTTCWAISARLWKLHFRCPDEYVEDKILLQKKIFFVHFLGNISLHSSRKRLAVWPKRKRRLICPQDHFEYKEFIWKIQIFFNSLVVLSVKWQNFCLKFFFMIVTTVL